MGKISDLKSYRSLKALKTVEKRRVAPIRPEDGYYKLEACEIICRLPYEWPIGQGGGFGPVICPNQTVFSNTPNLIHHIKRCHSGLWGQGPGSPSCRVLTPPSGRKSDASYLAAEKWYDELFKVVTTGPLNIPLPQDKLFEQASTSQSQKQQKRKGDYHHTHNTQSHTTSGSESGYQPYTGPGGSGPRKKPRCSCSYATDSDGQSQSGDEYQGGEEYKEAGAGGPREAKEDGSDGGGDEEYHEPGSSTGAGSNQQDDNEGVDQSEADGADEEQHREDSWSGVGAEGTQQGSTAGASTTGGASAGATEGDGTREPVNGSARAGSEEAAKSAAEEATAAATEEAEEAEEAGKAAEESAEEEAEHATDGAAEEEAEPDTADAAEEAESPGNPTGQASGSTQDDPIDLSDGTTEPWSPSDDEDEEERDIRSGRRVGVHVNPTPTDVPMALRELLLPANTNVLSSSCLPLLKKAVKLLQIQRHPDKYQTDTKEQNRLRTKVFQMVGIAFDVIEKYRREQLAYRRFNHRSGRSMDSDDDEYRD